MKINSSISDKVFSTLSQIKKRNEDRLFKIEQFLRSDATYSLLNTQLSSLNYKIGKARFNKLDTTILEQEKLVLEDKISSRLKELNLTPSYLNVKYNCKKCKDTGFYLGKHCSCFKKLYNKLFLEELGIVNKKLFTFENNTLADTNPLTELFNKFKTYCKDFKTQTINYIFFGKCGTGKTFLSECIVSELKNKFDVLYLNSFELNNIFVKIHTAPLEEKSFYYSCILETDLIVIDDLGTEPIYNNVTKEYLYLLLNERAKRQKPFIITTNLRPNELLNRYGDRIFTRLFASSTKTLEFPNQNLRN